MDTLFLLSGDGDYIPLIKEVMRQGKQVFVEGRIRTNKWQDKEGKDRYTTEIVVNEMTMLGGKSSGAGSFEVVENKPAAASGGAAAKPAPAKGSFDNFDDDIPF